MSIYDKYCFYQDRICLIIHKMDFRYNNNTSKRITEMLSNSYYYIILDGTELIPVFYCDNNNTLYTSDFIPSLLLKIARKENLLLY